MSSSGTAISITLSMCTPASANACACGMVRGKPSKMQPLAQSGSAIRALTRLIIKSSETSPPASMILLACLPSSVPSLIAARSISPVEICGILNSLVMICAWVPLPAPGGPKRIIRFINLFLKSKLLKSPYLITAIAKKTHKWCVRITNSFEILG